MINWRVVSVVLLFAIVQQSEFAAGQVVTAAGIPIEEGSYIGDVNFTIVAPNSIVNFNNGVNCGAGHTTANGGQYFNHLHISLTLPIAGLDTTGTPRTITAAKIKTLWDNHYDGYESEGSEDVTKNCHGYAFGLFASSESTWVQNTAFIHADDLVDCYEWENTDFFTDGSRHTIFVPFPGGLFGSPNEIHTKEKNRESRIYTATWGWWTQWFGWPDGDMKVFRD
jgi:hypothetical protein